MPVLNFIGGFQGGIEAAQRRQQLQFEMQAHQDEMQLRQQQLAMQQQRAQMDQQELDFRLSKMQRDQGLSDFAEYSAARISEGAQPPDFILDAPKFGLQSPEDVALGVTKGAMLAKARQQQDALQASLIGQRAAQTDLTKAKAEDVRPEDPATLEARLRQAGTPEDQITKMMTLNAATGGKGITSAAASRVVVPPGQGGVQKPTPEEVQTRVQNLIDAAGGEEHMQPGAKAALQEMISQGKTPGGTFLQWAFTDKHVQDKAIEATLKDQYEQASKRETQAAAAVRSYPSPENQDALKAARKASDDAINALATHRSTAAQRMNQPKATVKLTQEDFDPAARELPEGASPEDIKKRAREISGSRGK